ncbi:MAG: 1-acyl-sn-glycerol-3-phosphate acyltransferase [Myxococcales bacterium]|nr:1-acyl-sn-glycerol-3-phosphate acyltransferase [Myxococcales bacterium]
MKSLRILTADTSALRPEELRGKLVVANHPTYIDIVFLLALVPDAVCVFKRSILRNPVMRGPVYASGYLVNDDGPTLVASAAQVLAAGSSLVVFPEGTRSEAGGRLQPLHRGAAHAAIAANVALQPIAIRCDPPMLVRGLPWYRLPRTRSHFAFQRLDALQPRAGAPPPSEARRLTDHLASAFERAIASTSPQG